MLSSIYTTVTCMLKKVLISLRSHSYNFVTHIYFEGGESADDPYAPIPGEDYRGEVKS